MSRTCIAHVEADCKICFPHKKLCKCERCSCGKLRQRNSAERKAEPVHSGVLAYFPDALAAVSRVSKSGNDKHNPGEPLNWARGKSTDQLDCATRHSFTPNVVDAETGEPELAAMAWRVLAELQIAEEKRLVSKGIMPYSGVVNHATK